MGQHSHEHTHRLMDGNGHSVHASEVHDHAHAAGPTPDASRHHDHTEEPAIAAPGPITPGEWMLAATGDDPPGMARSDPGHYLIRQITYPGYIHVMEGDQEVVVAVVSAAGYWPPGEPYDAKNPTGVAVGSWEGNAKLMTFSPTLLRFVQSLASYQGVGIPDLAIKERALALIKQMNQLEVRSDADRW